jgi:putative ABC transport system ATP-binding protein
VHAVRGVTLSIAAGEMVAIMGPSGSGKSTMLNVLGTLDRPTAGEYRLDGESVGELDEPALASLRNHKIGFVFQSFNLLPRETALENVELPMIYAGAARAARRRKAEAALARVGLAERMDHLPNQLSGGQQQRVSIARAIVNEPLLLLADEPTGALDSKTARQVMELLLDLHRSGMTVAVVTHDPAVAAYAGRVITFRDGHVVSDERTQNETNPHPPAVRADLGLHG